MAGLNKSVKGDVGTDDGFSKEWENAAIITDWAALIGYPLVFLALI
jgi:hypothetical protein